MKKLSIISLLAVLVIACGSKENPGGETPGTGAPATPTGLAVHGNPTETSLSFQWLPVTGADAYSWKIEKDGQAVNNGRVTGRGVTVNGLTKATDYRFSVKAENAQGESAFASVDARTAGEVTPPSSVSYEDFAIPAVEEDGVARAFPGAEGGGMYTTGGRGGSVYHVTTLSDSGSGSLRYGIEQGARPLTIVFDVAGTIALNSQLNIKKGDLTIAGQTAPGDGICLKNYTFRISASNVIVRFIRCRMGDEKQTEDDAIQVMEHENDKYQKIIIDHCSVSWCTDECASFYGMKDFTFSWNIVSESLRNSIHDKGPHGYGGIWGGSNATYHHNLLAHHDSRNPRIDHDFVSTQRGPVSIFNNVVYNWEGKTCYGGESSDKNGSDYKKFNFFNNYYKPGPVTPSSHIWLLEPTTSCSNCGGTILPGHFYLDGNVMYGKSDINSNNWKADTKTGVGVYISASTAAQIKQETPYTWGVSQSIHTGEGCFNPVLNYAGASYQRDAIDTRIARETKNGEYTYEGSNLDPKKYDKDKDTWVSVERSYKGLIDTQTDVDPKDGSWKDGWPVYSATKEQTDAVKDADGDGIPDAVEDTFGLDRTNSADGKAVTLDKHGRYTNLEMYLHYLVKDIVAGQNQNATYTKL